MNWNYDEEDSYELSLTRFEAMLKTNKVFFFDSEEFENIILYYLDTGKSNMAKQALKLGLEQHPNSMELKLVQVEILIYDNKLDKADKILDELILIEPTNEDIYILRASVCSKRGNHNKAVEFLNEVLEYTEDSAEVYSLIGMEYLFMDEFEKAKENFIKSLEEDHNDYSTLYNIVYCFDFLEQHKEAVEFLNWFIDQNPYSEVAWHQLGIQHHELKEYELAIRAFEYAIVIDEYFMGAYMEKAKCLENLKRYEEAIACYNYTLELDDPTSFALHRIGKCYNKMGDKDMAVQYYHKAVHEDPLLDKAWLSIINLHIEEKNYEKALHYCGKALDTDKENYHYWKRYAEINEELGDVAETVVGYQNAMQFGDYDMMTILALADIYTEQKNYEAATQLLLEANDFYEYNIQTGYRLAGIYFTMGSKDNIITGKYHLIRSIWLSESELDCWILEELFPKVYKRRDVQRVIKRNLKTFGENKKGWL